MFLICAIVMISVYLPKRVILDERGMRFSFLFDEMIDGERIVLYDVSEGGDIPSSAEVVILSGEPAPGIDPSALAKKLVGKWLGIVEFNPSWDLARKVALLKGDGKVFRVHTVRTEEVEKLRFDKKALFHRFRRAVFERSVEVLWVRDELPWKDELVEDLKKSLRGKEVSFPAPPQESLGNFTWMLLIPTLFLVASLHPLLLGVLIVLPFSYEWFVSLSAIFGVLGAYFVPKKRIVKLVSVLLLSLCVLLVLSDFNHLNHLLEFRGVKVSLTLLPAIILIKGLWRHRRNWKRYLPIFLVSIPIGLYYISRSGNYGFVGDLERKFRDFVEEILLIRPRFKEVFTYPFFWLRGVREEIDFLVEALGSVAIVSLFNTFCHVKTPVLVSLARSFLGVLLGYLLFLFLKVPLKRILTNE